MRSKSGKALGVVVIIMALAVIAGGGVWFLTGCDDEGGGFLEPEKIINPITGYECEEELPARPIMCSIDNVGDAVPQSNISYADIVYEFPVEGLQTRLQAIYLSEFPEFFGPLRSVRPYFVNLAQEYNAIYVAHGWSWTAKKWLQDYYDVPYMNAMEDATGYYRVSDKAAPHNSYVTLEEIQRRSEANGWCDEQHPVQAFKFRDEEWQQEQDELKAAAEEGKVIKDEEGNEIKYVEPEKASDISFKYTNSGCEFKYDSETGDYARYRSGQPYVDKETGEQIKVQNVLVQYVSSKVYDEKGRLKIHMCGGGDAVLFTDGEVIKGKWKREKLSDKTVFIDQEGNEFRLSQGKSWVEVIDQTCTFSYQ